MTRLFGIAQIAVGAASLLTWVTATSQPRDASDAWCDQSRPNRRGITVHCEVREFELASRDRVAVDGGGNGGIEVTGWDRDDILVRARVQVWSESNDPARIAESIEIITDEPRIRAEGPRSQNGVFGSRHEGWAVSFELQVPFESDLLLDATNGGIAIADVDGELEFDTTNGGIQLERVAGDVRGRTTNGGIRVDLDADEWVGRGLDLQTTNGGITIDVPAGFRADLEATTVNGGLRTDFPVVVDGRIGRRRLEAELNGGGAPVRLATVNGGVSVREK